MLVICDVLFFVRFECDIQLVIELKALRQEVISASSAYGAQLAHLPEIKMVI